jgi:hypothetical protein
MRTPQNTAMVLRFSETRRYKKVERKEFYR